MEWIIISNDGELEVNGLKLMGASSKRDDDSFIGKWGSGSKNALAVLARNSIPVRIFSGAEEIVVGTRIQKLKGEEHLEVTLDGEGINVTTGLGPNWEPWMAFREFLCNAIDEAQYNVQLSAELPKPSAGRTYVCIALTEEMRGVWESRHLRFRLDTSEGTALPGGRMLERLGDGTRVYKQGILVYESPSVSIRDWDSRDVKINEERIAPYSDACLAAWKLMQELSTSDKINLLADLSQQLDAFEGSVPGCLPWNWKGHTAADWAEAVGNKVVVTKREAKDHAVQLAKHATLVLPDSWISILRKVDGIKFLNDAVRVLPARPDTPVVPSKNDGIASQAVRIAASFGLPVTSEVVLVGELREDWVLKDGVIWVQQGLSLRKTVACIVSAVAERDQGHMGLGDKMAEMMVTVMSRYRKELG